MLELNVPNEARLDENDLFKAAHEKKKSVKGWWLFFSINTAAWLLYPFIGPKGGPAPIHRMPYYEALVEFVWVHLILSAITYYYLIVRVNFDLRSNSKMVLLTTIEKVKEDAQKNKITLYTSNKKPKRFTIYTLEEKVDTNKPIVIHYLKRTKTILHYSQSTKK